MRGSVEFLELLGDFEGAVGGGVVYYYDFPGEIAGERSVSGVGVCELMLLTAEALTSR